MPRTQTTGRWRVSVFGDTHAGSDAGLMVSDKVKSTNGAEHGISPASKWLREFFLRHLEREAEAAKDHDMKVVVIMGDVCDGGFHHKNLNHYSLDPTVERQIALDIVETAVEALEPDLIFSLLGSGSHVGNAGEREEAVGSWLAGRYGDRFQRPNDYRYGWGRVKAEWGGVRFDCKHEGRMGRLENTRESYFVRAMEEVYQSYVKYKDVDWVPDVALRAHNHKFVQTPDVAPHKRGLLGFGLPCYQLDTYWANQKFETRPDIGMLGLTCQDGMVRDRFPQVEHPIHREPVWKP